MKFIKQIVERVCKRVTKTVTVVAVGLFLLAPVCRAQDPQAISLKYYQVTNAATFTMLSATNIVQTANTNIILSKPFQIWRGRGFAFNWAFTQTNANTTNFGWRFRFGNIITLPGGGKSTNWQTVPTLTVISPTLNLAGTNVFYGSTNVPPSLVDNVQVGQLMDVTNFGPHTLIFDPTNTYITAFP